MTPLSGAALVNIIARCARTQAFADGTGLDTPLFLIVVMPHCAQHGTRTVSAVWRPLRAMGTDDADVATSAFRSDPAQLAFVVCVNDANPDCYPVAVYYDLGTDVQVVLGHVSRASIAAQLANMSATTA